MARQGAVRRRARWSAPAALLFAICLATPALAHVPYLERRDYSPESPFVVADAPENSKALYSWIESPTDVDVHVVPVDGFTRLFAQILVPACAQLAPFAPSLAIVGPGIPAPELGQQPGVPIPLEQGVGAVVMHGQDDPTSRPVMFEPFGGKSYFESTAFDKRVWDRGGWRVVVWHPQGAMGDYVLVLGTAEVFSGTDIIRSIVNTAAIRLDLELHGPCTPVD